MEKMLNIDPEIFYLQDVNFLKFFINRSIADVVWLVSGAKVANRMEDKMRDLSKYINIISNFHSIFFRLGEIWLF